ncbi:MAG TPA: SulP family inorganic anion transporter [Gemmatales bacterium]|nr:SulP family inorganic anion transporter [Gemmatales bacterium]
MSNGNGNGRGNGNGNGSSQLSQLVLRDLLAGLVVFFVALPLCLGIALASGAPLFSGLIAGIVGGLVVGVISKSQTSVSGPAAGLTAVVAAQIAGLGTFDSFLLAVFFAGLFQMGLGLARCGAIADFVPNAVIKGLLAAIGIILILKQIPHLLGDDTALEGDFSFFQVNQETTFSEFLVIMENYDVGAIAIGLSSLLLLIAWERIKWLKQSPVPAPLVVVLWGGMMVQFLSLFEQPWLVEQKHLVDVPVVESLGSVHDLLRFPDFEQWRNPRVYLAAITICLVASLETLLNLEAGCRSAPKRRSPPPNRELVAQGAGNMVCGLIGGLPVTSVIVRSSVNIQAGAQSKLSAIFHGLILAVCVVLIPQILNMIPLACLAAILIMTGVKLSSPKIIADMWKKGWDQFLPFIVTVLAIVFTDLLLGIIIGLCVSLAHILLSNIRRPLRRVWEKHIDGEVLHIELSTQVSFLNRAALTRTLNEVPRGGHVLIDARVTEFVDPDILTLIRDFERDVAPARGVKVSLIGFKDAYAMEDRILFADYTNKEVQGKLTPAEALQALKDGHERFRTGHMLHRNLHRLVKLTASNQYPLAAILSCIDSRAPVEILFDQGLGDVFSIRIAGNVAKAKVLGSLEYCCAVAGVKVVLVMGHTNCGAVNTALKLKADPKTHAKVSDLTHLGALAEEINKSITPELVSRASLGDEEFQAAANELSERNVYQVMNAILESSPVIARSVREGRLIVAGSVYDLATGDVKWLKAPANGGGDVA